MEYIAHRINTIAELSLIPFNYGVELDLRDYNNNLILHHDPFKNGDSFEEYLKSYNHGTMIINIKSERIEYRALELLEKYNIKKYFFLDSSFPMIYLLSKNGVKNIAVRFSEFEAIETILNMKNRVDWVWIDCFNHYPLDYSSYEILKDNFKLCLVSPELQSHDISMVKKFIKLSKKMPFDAVCTKRIKLWEDFN